MSRHTWCNYTGCLSGHECSLNSAHWCTPFTTNDLYRISQDTVQTVATASWWKTAANSCRLQLFAAVFHHLPLRTTSCHVHFPSSVSGSSRMQDLLPGFQIKFVASLRLQPDIWKRFYSLKFLTLPRTFNIVMSAGHFCKWTQNRRRYEDALYATSQWWSGQCNAKIRSESCFSSTLCTSDW